MGRLAADSGLCFKQKMLPQFPNKPHRVGHLLWLSSAGAHFSCLLHRECRNLFLRGPGRGPTPVPPRSGADKPSSLASRKPPSPESCPNRHEKGGLCCHLVVTSEYGPVRAGGGVRKAALRTEVRAYHVPCFLCLLSMGIQNPGYLCRSLKFIISSFLSLHFKSSLCGKCKKETQYLSIQGLNKTRFI